MPQYSQNVSEQIMKSDKLGSGLPWKLLAFSVFIFLLAVLSYFALSLGYSNYLNNQISQTEDNTRALTQKVSTDAQNKFIDIYSRLSNYKSILADHIYASGVFPLLESITYPTIYYTDVQLNTTDSTLVLSGIAADFNSLSLQLRGYDSAKDMISSYVLNQSRVVANQVNFRITLNLSSKVFKK